LRDPVYDLIAQNRYAIFGRTDACMVPSPGDRERFLA
jgi:predicted DCC family thiol-disulfide oxidoreductase YuxK